MRMASLHAHASRAARSGVLHACVDGSSAACTCVELCMQRCVQAGVCMHRTVADAAVTTATTRPRPPASYCSHCRRSAARTCTATRGPLCIWCAEALGLQERWEAGGAMVFAWRCGNKVHRALSSCGACEVSLALRGPLFPCLLQPVFPYGIFIHVVHLPVQ